jgi:Raf kinase inhibitor-like YbhB/YbcL family protein
MKDPSGGDLRRRSLIHSRGPESGDLAPARTTLADVARARIICLLVVIAALLGCGDDKAEEPNVPQSIALASPAFDAGSRMPRRFSCDDAELSPPLTWRKVPDGATSLALVMEDPDAPNGTFVHWTVFAIAPDAREFLEGEAPKGSLEGENSFDDVGYVGPCPPEGDKAHRYVFELYALHSEPALKRGAKPDEVRDAIAKHAMARGRLVGMFKRG